MSSNPNNFLAESLVGHEILATYRLTEPLGQGGMSVVYRARHLLTDQDVAVKVLPPQLAKHPDVKARFIEEARTLARLEHPNIVLLHNFLEEDGILYLIMQFAEGETFDDLIATHGRVPYQDVIRVGAQVLRALSYAHEQQVIHRDIKPSNIIIRPDQVVKVMDFGIAKIVGSRKLTQSGQTMGTVRYMSPEQVRGKHIDHRTDLYSLGIALYEGITGHTPFDGDTHFEIMRKHLSEAPRPAGELVPIPPELDQILTVALAKPQDDRYPSASDFLEALEQIPLETGVSASQQRELTPGPTSHPKRQMWPLALAIALLLVSAAGVLWVVLDDRTPPRAAIVAKKATRKPPPSTWPEPHRALQNVKLTVDQTDSQARLRVLASRKVDLDAIIQAYSRAKGAFRDYVRDHGFRADFTIGGLNLAILRNHFFQARPGWKGRRYDYPSATLFIRNRPDFLLKDLPFGFALHFCGRMLDASNQRCLELASGFERTHTP